MHTVFLINLARSTERLVNSSNALDINSIEFERMNAVDGQTLANDEMEKYCAKPFARYYKKLSKTEVACFLSHRQCWREIIDRNLPWAIILEDDMQVDRSLSTFIQSIADIPFDWDCLKLMEHPIKRKEKMSQAFKDWQVVTYNKVPARTGAYVLSQSGAIKMLAANQKIVRPVDIEFQYWWEHNLRIYGVKPYPVSVAKNTESTIDSASFRRKRADKRLLKRVYEQIVYLFKNARNTSNLVKQLQAEYSQNRTSDK